MSRRLKISMDLISVLENLRGVAWWLVAGVCMVRRKKDRLHDGEVERYVPVGVEVSRFLQTSTSNLVLQRK
jgi:hypothetical protein